MPPSNAEDNRDPERNETDYDDPDTPPVPLDGGWGWMVVAASLLCNIIVDGVCFSFGVLYLELLKEFGESKGKTAWVGSLVPGMYLSMGPIVSALANHFGCRTVTIIGSIVASVSFFVSTFSPNVNVLIITYGVCGGIGFGLMYLPSIVIVGYYFDTKRAFATGIAVCGSGIGTLIFGPFTRILLDEYGWQGTNWIISAIILHGIACGLLFRPLENNRPVPKKGKELDDSVVMQMIIAQKRQRLISTGSMDGSLLTKDNKLIKDPEEIQRILEKYNTQWHANGQNVDRPSLKRIPSNSSSTTGIPKVPSNPENLVLAADKTTEENISASHQDISSSKAAVNKQVQKLKYSSNSSLRKRTTSGHYGDEGQLLTASQASIRSRTAYRPMYRQDVLYSGSVTSLAEFKSTSDMSTYVRSYTHIPDVPDDPTSCEAKCLPLVTVLKQMLDFSLMKSVTFVILCTASILAMTGFFTPFVYITDNAMSMGVPAKQAVYLLSLLGLCNTIGRIISGWLSDRSWADCLLIHNLALIIAGVATMCVPFLTNYAMLAAYCCVFGLCIAGFIALRSIVICDLMGVGKLSNALGLLLLFQGLASVVGTPLSAGYIALRSIVITELLGVRYLMNALGLLFMFQGFASVVGSPLAAAFIALRSIVLVDLLGIKKLNSSFGLLLLFQGISCIIGSPLAGAIFDATGSYRTSFMVSGGLIALAGVICLPIRRISDWENRRAGNDADYAPVATEIDPDTNSGESMDNNHRHYHRQSNNTSNEHNVSIDPNVHVSTDNTKYEVSSNVSAI